MRNKITSTKNFVINHKVGFAVVSTAALCLYINVVTWKSYNEFLEEENLIDKFYELSN